MAPSRRLQEASVGMTEAFAKLSRSLLGDFSKPSAPATSSRALHEDVAGAEGHTHGGFAKAPRAPSFGNDSSDNDKRSIGHIVLLEQRYVMVHVIIL